jgi:hypothetical protein
MQIEGLTWINYVVKLELQLASKFFSSAFLEKQLQQIVAGCCRLLKLSDTLSLRYHFR